MVATWCCLGLALLGGSLALAGQDAAPAQSSSKLKWHTRGVPVKAEPAKAEASKSEASQSDVGQMEASKAVSGSGSADPGLLSKAPPARPLKRRVPAATSRARLRDSIMQVGGSLAGNAPADDASTDLAPPAETLPEPNDQGAMSEERPSDDRPSDTEPAPLKPGVDPFADEPIPTPPDQEERLPPGDLSEGISTAPGDLSCKEYGAECRRAIADLQRRDITKIAVGLEIEGVEGEDFPCDCKLGINVDAPDFPGRHFARTTFTWKATIACHKPLYFEDVQLERYGHSWNPVVQPFMSAAHFFVSVPLLPYNMGLNPPGECMYSLGYYRPGSCAPYLLEPIPFSLRAAIFEGLGVTGFAFWLWPG